MRRLQMGIVGLATAALIVTACGGGASNQIEATLTDFEFTPSEWTVNAGEEISLDLTNDGAVEHEFVILQSGVEITSEDDLPETEEELLADYVYWEDEIEPGESKTLTFTAPDAGTYEVICAIDGHFDAGMNGTLTVESP